MKDDGDRRIPQLRMVASFGAAGLLAGFAAIYAIFALDGKVPDESACEITEKSFNNLRQFAAGDVAAFLPASEPLSVKELSFSRENGEKVAVADFNGKTILLNLWATWCAPCREEMPALDALQRDLGSDAFEVVAVNIDKGDSGKPLAFLEEIGVKNLSYWADPTLKIFTDLKQMGKAPGLPTTMLVDGNGCEAGVIFGPAEWNSEDSKSLIRAALREPDNS